MLQTKNSTNRWAGMPGLLNLVRRKTETAEKQFKEVRSHIRIKAAYTGTVSGPSGSLEFRGIDVHKYGAGITTNHQLEPDSVVFIHVKSLQRMGFAYVRHCTPRGISGYFVGLEFRSELMQEEVGQWQFQHIRQAEEAPEPSMYIPSPSKPQ